jgi:hypothetical protein
MFLFCSQRAPEAASERQRLVVIVGQRRAMAIAMRSGSGLDLHDWVCLEHGGAALHFEQRAGGHQRGDSDRGACICGYGQELLSRINIVLPVAPKVNDEARHLENLIQPRSRRPR